jgi:hypothetical protein
MIADFVDIKDSLDKFANTYYRGAVYQNAPFIANISRHIQHEGKIIKYQTQNGQDHILTLREISAQTNIKDKDVKTLSLIDVLKKFGEMAKEMAQKMEIPVFKMMEDMAEAGGNVVSNADFTPDTVLKALEKLDIDFNEQGKPIMPSMVISPELFKSIQGKLPGWEADLSIQKQFNAIIKKKYEDWVRRKNDRKLVG